MVKRVIICCVLFGVANLLVAGDVAAFVDEGFSSDGDVYVFGQYGSIDKTWQGYAEIYTVDISQNDYVDNGLFKTPASSVTAGKNGHSLYSELRSANKSYLDNLKLAEVGIDKVLFLRGSSVSNSGKIVITDFEGSAHGNTFSYSIELTPWYSGTSSSSQSSFFISVEKHDQNGALIGKQVIGNPDIKRRGVVGYEIEKIIQSPDGNSLIFIIEKKLATSNGESIRYMVETLEVERFN